MKKNKGTRSKSLRDKLKRQDEKTLRDKIKKLKGQDLKS